MSRPHERIRSQLLYIFRSTYIYVQYVHAIYIQDKMTLFAAYTRWWIELESSQNVNASCLYLEGFEKTAFPPKRKGTNWRLSGGEKETLLRRNRIPEDGLSPCLELVKLPFLTRQDNEDGGSCCAPFHVHLSISIDFLQRHYVYSFNVCGTNNTNRFIRLIYIQPFSLFYGCNEL